MHWFTAQSCQPLRFGISLLRSRALHYTATLMIISIRSPQKNNLFKFSISCMHVGIKFASNWLCVCLFCVWDVSCATANRRSCFNQLSRPIIAFGSIPTLMHHFLMRQLLFLIISNRHAEARSWKQASGLWILSATKNTLQNFREECYTEKFLCVVRSTQSAKHGKWSSCFFSSWDFSVAHGGMYDIKQRVNLKCHINKGKAIGSTLKISH